MPYSQDSLPLLGVINPVASLLFNQRRSFRQDAQACIARLKPPLRLFGAENIPASGPCVVTVNHYHRPGFGAWWIALAAAAAVPAEMHWVMTGELTYPGKWYAFLGKPVSRWLLRRLAKMYGFTAMPPMPPREKDVAQRAVSVRLVLDRVRRNPDSMLAVSPEGEDHPGGILGMPSPGVGRFLSLLAGAGFAFVPVGCWEEDKALCLRFGAAYRLEVPPGLRPDERDRHAARIAMRAIAGQLPPPLRGEFNDVQPGE